MWNVLAGTLGVGYWAMLGMLKKDPKKEEARILAGEMEGYARNAAHWGLLERCAKALAIRKGASELSAAERDILFYELLREASEGEVVSIGARLKLLEAEIADNEAVENKARKEARAREDSLFEEGERLSVVEAELAAARAEIAAAKAGVVSELAEAKAEIATAATELAVAREEIASLKTALEVANAAIDRVAAGRASKSVSAKDPPISAGWTHGAMTDIRFVVNGSTTTLSMYDGLQTVAEAVKTVLVGMVGDDGVDTSRPAEDWELRDESGALIDQTYSVKMVVARAKPDAVFFLMLKPRGGGAGQ